MAAAVPNKSAKASNDRMSQLGGRQDFERKRLVETAGRKDVSTRSIPEASIGVRRHHSLGGEGGEVSIGKTRLQENCHRLDLFAGSLVYRPDLAVGGRGPQHLPERLPGGLVLRLGNLHSDLDLDDSGGVAAPEFVAPTTVAGKGAIYMAIIDSTDQHGSGRLVGNDPRHPDNGSADPRPGGSRDRPLRWRVPGLAQLRRMRGDETSAGAACELGPDSSQLRREAVKLAAVSLFRIG